MKCVIKRECNPNIVKIAIQEYVTVNNFQNLEKLFTACLAYSLSATNLQSINFEIKNLNVGKAAYHAGTILFDSKYFHTINKETLHQALTILFHELSHAIEERCNQIVLATKRNTELYMGEFNTEAIYDIIYQQTKSSFIAKGATYFMYYKCPNEIFARRNSYDMCEEFYKQFLPERLSDLPNFQQKTNHDLEMIYKIYPFLKNNEKYYYDLMEQYQLNEIEKGLAHLTNKQSMQLIESFAVCFNNNIRKALIKECIEQGNTKLLIEYLSNPYFCPRPDEMAKLQVVFSKEVLAQHMFKRTPGATKISKMIAISDV